MYDPMKSVPQYSNSTGNVQVKAASRELSSEQFSKQIIDFTNRKILELIHSKESADKLGGILAIGMVCWKSTYYILIYSRQTPRLGRGRRPNEINALCKLLTKRPPEQ
jgi:hypothetical protein